MANWSVNLDTNVTNPQPEVSDEPDVLVGDFLSPAKLQEITGQDNLNAVETLEMVINTSDTTLGNFGQYLPNLKQFKLNDSSIPSVRDIGTAFSNLTVLWMSRCKLNDLDGIASMSLLQELYVSYNNIEDLSPISFLDSLEILDLEGNIVSDINQLDYLLFMNNLTNLTLTSNPVCYSFSSSSNQSFREYVLAKFPNLKVLNDYVTSVLKVDESTSMQLHEDIDIVTSAIKVATDLENKLESISLDSSLPSCSRSKSNSMEDLSQSTSSKPLIKFDTARPSTAAVPSRKQQFINAYQLNSSIISSNTRPGSSGSDSGIMLSDDSSNLTFGDPLCGNLIHALKQRKKSPISSSNFLYDFSDMNSDVCLRPATSLGFKLSRNSDKSFFDFSSRLSVSTANEHNSSSVSKPPKQVVSNRDEKLLAAVSKDQNLLNNGVHLHKSPSSIHIKVSVYQLASFYVL